MKKALVAGVLALLLVALGSLTACNDDNAAATSEPEPEPPAKVEQPPSETKVVTKEKEDDPLWIYDDNSTSQGYYLLRGEDKCYHLASSVAVQPGREYSPGSITRATQADDEVVGLYSHNSNFGDKTVGEVPIPVLRSGDRIILRADYVSDLSLYPVEIKGYSCMITTKKHNPKNYLCRLWDLQTKQIICEIPIYTLKDEETEFRSEDGERLSYSQFYNSLEKDKRYTVSWWEGTKYYEYEFVADCLSFVYDKAEEIIFPGQLNKEEAHTEYDMEAILDLPSGLYFIGGACVLIEIP